MPAKRRTAGRKPGKRGCHALTRKGLPCGQPAMRGQKVCKMHGGMAPQNRAAAAERLERERQAERATRAARRLLGGELLVNPLEALLGQVREAAANVEALRELAASLASRPDQEELREYRRQFRRWEKGERSDAPEPPAALYGINHLGDGAPHVLVIMYAEERDRLVKFSKAAVDAGATEKMLELEARRGHQVARIITRLLDDPRLGLEQQARTIGRGIAAELLRALAAEEAPPVLELTA